MANATEKVNGIAIADIQAINGITDSNLQALNGLEFTGTIPDDHTLIATATASTSATLEFTSGIDSTYDVYEFRFTNMHPATDDTELQFQFNAAGGSGYNETITSTAFRAYHPEAGGDAEVGYHTSSDQAQGTSFERIVHGIGNDNDQGVSGMLTLYGPSSTSYVKHWVLKVSNSQSADQAYNMNKAGYINTTSAIDDIQFKMASGNIDAGVIKMFGVS